MEERKRTVLSSSRKSADILYHLNCFVKRSLTHVTPLLTNWTLVYRMVKFRFTIYRKNSHGKGTHKQTHTQTLWLLDQRGPEGRVGENPRRDTNITTFITGLVWSGLVWSGHHCWLEDLQTPKWCCCQPSVANNNQPAIQQRKYRAYPDFFVGLLGIGKSGD